MEASTGKVGGINYYKAGELLLSTLGLTFIILSHHISIMLVITYVLSTMYMILALICQISGKMMLSATVQAIMEVALAILIIIFTVVLIADGETKDVWQIFAVIIGFLLPCLFVITAYDKF